MRDKDDKLEVMVTNGDMKVRLHNEGYGLELLIMRNGFQWTGQQVSDELLDMIISCIEEYKANKDQPF